MGRQIAWAIHQCANTSNTIVGLGHPSLITYLCRRVGVDVSLPPFARLCQIIHINYINKYCSAQDGPIAPTSTPRRRVHSGTVLRREHFDASMQAMYKAQTIVMDTLRGLSLHGSGSPLTFHIP